MQQSIIYTRTITEALCPYLQGKYDKVFVLTDANTHHLCLPLLDSVREQFEEITLPAGDDHKDVDALCKVWSKLQSAMATRHSLLINLGGGMITDLGGFAAACFKRGIAFVNVPTTLLAMVDAAVGGKTGINFHTFKNEIGAFAPADAVIIDTDFLKTLSSEDILSGYAEMLKHALLNGERMWAEHLAFDIDTPDYEKLLDMVRQSVETKARIVREDPTEKGIRKALNAGHTIGHALESLAMQKGEVGLHGRFVAWGLVGELFLSLDEGLSDEVLRHTFNFVRNNYLRCNFTCDDYEQLYELMLHDKKNSGGQINFTLFRNIGEPLIDAHVSKEMVFQAFDFIREA